LRNGKVTPMGFEPMSPP